MTANPLKIVETRSLRMNQQELVDHGNAHLASIGRGHEAHWFIQNGRVTIGWR